jgi:uncharacterized protein YecT (DUF1311 family)
MNQKAPSPHILRYIGTRLGLAVGIVLMVAPGTLTSSAAEPQAERRTALKLGSECDGTPTAIDRLICADPSLAVIDTALDAAFRDYRDRAARPAEREARLAEQRRWLDGRARACPAATPPSSSAPPEAVRRESAVACLSRIYEQRVAVLRYERNAASWPRVRFRPTLLRAPASSYARICGAT